MYNIAANDCLEQGDLAKYKPRHLMKQVTELGMTLTAAQSCTCHINKRMLNTRRERRKGGTSTSSSILNLVSDGI